MADDSVIEFQDSSSENPFGEPELSRPSPKRTGWLSGVSDTLQRSFSGGSPKKKAPSKTESREDLISSSHRQALSAGNFKNAQRQPAITEERLE
ncbi:hypothetical protein WJX84_002920 [Apatococcus fuscideae]|uniref:Uncharacterized protein n=1 Tax=Apatococcus fuscideae TaxID=2026836 RepID=A0AAW1SRL9_9CHLO